MALYREQIDHNNDKHFRIASHRIIDELRVSIGSSICLLLCKILIGFFLGQKKKSTDAKGTNLNRKYFLSPLDE